MLIKRIIISIYAKYVPKIFNEVIYIFISFCNIQHILF